MRSVFAGLALAALASANPAPQAVTSSIAPASSPPAGCVSSHAGTFEIQVVNVTTSSKRDVVKRDALVISLSSGTLTDSKGRTGYIAANNQFQFDSPPQAGAKYTSGWSACSNGSLAIGGSTIFYQCLSGTFYNLYDKSTGDQCSPVYIDIISSGASAGVATAISDGQVTASAAAPVTQISDGQIQASTSAAPVTQISDGQIQAPTSTAKVAPVTQISDGQIQAPTSTGKIVTQISDGQIQAPTSTAKASPVTQISDGQIQAPVATGTGHMNTTKPTSSPIPYQGGSSAVQASFSFGAGLLALALLL